MELGVCYLEYEFALEKVQVALVPPFKHEPHMNSQSTDRYGPLDTSVLDDTLCEDKSDSLAAPEL